MQKENAVTGQVKGLHNINRLGVILMTMSLAVTSAHAVSASRTVSVGNAIFGATANSSFSDSAVGPKYRATASGRADGRILSAIRPLASGTSSLEIQPQSRCRADGFLRAAGVTVAIWNKSFLTSTNFSTPRFFKPVLGGSTTVWVGPLPVTIKSMAKVSVHAKGAVNVSFLPTGLRVVRGTFGPDMDATATVSGGVSLAFAGVDVSGSIKLVDQDTTANVSYTNQIGRNPFVTYCATTILESTDGAIKACAWIDPPFLPRSEWCRTLYSYTGARSSYVLACGSRQL